MFTLGTAWWEIIIRSVAVYAFVLIALRLTGRRSLGQRNALDLVLILVVANAVQNAMIGSDTSLLGGIIAAATLFAVDEGLDRIQQRDRRARSFFSGTPIVLIHHGQVIQDNLRHSHVTMDDIEEVLREHGYDSLHDVKTCILEMDGTLSIVPQGSHTEQTRRVQHPRMRRPRAVDRPA